MKKLFLIGLMSLMGLAGGTAVAQHGAGPRPTHHTLTFESSHGESYMVYLDGNVVNRMPQSRVMVNDLTDRQHEVVVVLRRPVEKAAVLRLVPGEPNVVVKVNYDARIEELSLYTPAHNRVEERDYAIGRDHHRDHHHADKPAVVVVEKHPDVHYATEEDVQGMVARMKAQSFDSDKLALGKVIVASSNLTAAQITRLAETIDFSSSQVDFLKYAYHYCVDPVNYYKTVEVLTFSSDKKKVLDYIATQR